MTEGMTDSRHCIRCDRGIDAHARLCPYCNWDQTETPPAAPPPPPATDYVPPEEHNKRRVVFMAAGGALLLFISFALGSMIHGANPEETAAKTGGSIVSQTAAPAPSAKTPVGPHANVDLVPVDPNAPLSEAPITSAPAPDAAQGTPNEYQRSDATAVSSAEYQQLAARAKMEKQQLIDPRLLTAPVFSKPRPRPQPQQQAAAAEQEAAPKPQSISLRTPPRALSVSFPEVHVDRDTTVHLTLLVGADGRVHSVDIDGALPGQTAQLIAAIHGWRFQPATENGVPVPSQFSTAVSFHANE